jgi:hypothetical protein
MGIARMRNKITGEFRDVDDASVDFLRLKQEVGPDNQSKWEQTGDHDVRATVDRARRGALLEQDLGNRAFPLPLNASSPMLSPEVAPHKALTAGEIECGIEDQDMKVEQERDMHMRSLLAWADDNQLKTAREQAEKGEGPLASHPSFVRERALSLGQTAVLDDSDTSILEEDDEEYEDDDSDDEETPAQRKRRLAKARAARKRRVQQANSDDSEPNRAGDDGETDEGGGE